MESTPEQASEGRALVTVLACVLEKLIQANANSGVSQIKEDKPVACEDVSVRLQVLKKAIHGVIGIMLFWLPSRGLIRRCQSRDSLR